MEEVEESGGFLLFQLGLEDRNVTCILPGGSVGVTSQHLWLWKDQVRT